MIRATALTKRYGSTVAVDGLAFEVRPGVVTGFLGPNGAGKTTTMRLILGLDTPTSGSITVNGRQYANHRFPLHEVGALLDAKALHPSRSAYNHLLSLAQSNRIAPSRVEAVLGMVGLNDVASRRVGKFSLGMGQRLGIAAALLGDPPILMFDEPVNGLDPEGIVWIRNLLRSLADEGRTIFVSSHLMSEMAVTADELVVVGRGRLIVSGTIDEIVGNNHASPESQRLRDALVRRNASVVEVDGAMEVRGLDAATIGDAAFEAGIVVHELAPQQDSLEDAYFRLTEDSVDFHAHDDEAQLQAAS